MNKKLYAWSMNERGPSTSFSAVTIRRKSSVLKPWRTDWWYACHTSRAPNFRKSSTIESTMIRSCESAKNQCPTIARLMTLYASVAKSKMYSANSLWIRILAKVPREPSTSSAMKDTCVKSEGLFWATRIDSNTNHRLTALFNNWESACCDMTSISCTNSASPCFDDGDRQQSMAHSLVMQRSSKTTNAPNTKSALPRLILRSLASIHHDCDCATEPSHPLSNRSKLHWPAIVQCTL